MENTVLIETLSTGFFLARQTNTTDASFPARVPTMTEPTGVGDNVAQTTSAVFDLGKGGSLTQNSLLIVPFGTGSDDTTFSARVIGWRFIKGTTPQNGLWIPVNLGEFAFTLGTSVGVAGAVIPATMAFADIVSITTPNTNGSYETINPSDNTIGSLILDLKGIQKLEVTFSTGSSATDANALLALL